VETWRGDEIRNGLGREVGTCDKWLADLRISNPVLANTSLLVGYCLPSGAKLDNEVMKKDHPRLSLVLRLAVVGAAALAVA
jgi:hypothetical protein